MGKYYDCKSSRKYQENIHSSLCLDCIAGFAAQTRSLAITYSHFLLVFMDHCLSLTEKDNLRLKFYCFMKYIS